jgi:hypothetical protein
MALRMVICHASNVERHFDQQRVSFDWGKYRRSVGDGNIHTLIAALPEEEKTYAHSIL